MEPFDWYKIQSVPKIVIYHPNGALVLSREPIWDKEVPKKERLISIASWIQSEAYSKVAKACDSELWAFSNAKGNVLCVTEANNCFSFDLYTQPEFCQKIKDWKLTLEKEIPTAQFIFELVTAPKPEE